jgi:hypothetical protein
MVAIWLVCFVGFAVPSAGLAGEQAEAVASLDLLDLEVAGLPHHATRSDLLVRLGEPREFIPSPVDTFCGTGPHPEMYIYPGLIVTFERGGDLVSVRLIDSTHATRRGLRVGQRAKDALALYGRPFYQHDRLLIWQTLGVSGGVISISASMEVTLSKKGVITAIELSP